MNNSVTRQVGGLAARTGHARRKPWLPCTSNGIRRAVNPMALHRLFVIVCVGRALAGWALPAKAFLPTSPQPTTFRFEVDLDGASRSEEALALILKQAVREQAQPGQVAWLDNHRHETASKASAVLKTAHRHRCPLKSQVLVASEGAAVMVVCFDALGQKAQLVLKSAAPASTRWSDAVCGLDARPASMAAQVAQTLARQLDELRWSYCTAAAL
jgi:hypothetical protein